MDELVDILDEHGNHTGQTCLKSDAHRKGLFHPTVHVWLYTPEGKILFQKRGKNKRTFPMLWDVSVAGHIASGEDIIEAAIREAQEEIGLDIAAKDLEKIGCFKSVHQHHETLIDKEFHHTFVCKLQTFISNLIKQESEVEDLGLFTLSDFKLKVTQQQIDGYVPHEFSYYQTIIAEIEQRL